MSDQDTNGLLPSDIKREWILKLEGETDPNFGCMPRDRPIEQYILNGVVNLDKPRGPTSHTVVDWVKKMLKVNKTGHTGTLDPAVTGSLPVCISNATKVVQAILPAGKEYICVMRLHKSMPKEKVIQACKSLVGTISQRPPLKSAVVRKTRNRQIYYLDVLEIEDKDVLFQVGCEAGTYIRTLCVQIGELLGIKAHMSELRRTRTGPFDESTLVKLYELKDAYDFWKEEQEEKYLRTFIQPVEAAVKHLPKIVVHDSAVDYICNGSPVMVPGILKLETGIKPKDLISVFTLKGELVALGRALMPSQEIIDRKKGMAIKTDRVLLKLGTYPRKKKA